MFDNITQAMKALRDKETHLSKLGVAPSLESDRKFLIEVMALGVKLFKDAKNIRD
jgi:hypothetical protein